MHVSRSSRVVILNGSTTLILKGSAQERRPSPGPDVLTAAPHFARLAGPPPPRTPPPPEAGFGPRLRRDLLGSGRGIRPPDLRVMSPTSYHCSIPRRTKQGGRHILCVRLNVGQALGH